MLLELLWPSRTDQRPNPFRCCCCEANIDSNSKHVAIPAPRKKNPQNFTLLPAGLGVR